MEKIQKKTRENLELTENTNNDIEENHKEKYSGNKNEDLSNNPQVIYLADEKWENIVNYANFLKKRQVQSEKDNLDTNIERSPETRDYYRLKNKDKTKGGKNNMKIMEILKRLQNYVMKHNNDVHNHSTDLSEESVNFDNSEEISTTLRAETSEGSNSDEFDVGFYENILKGIKNCIRTNKLIESPSQGMISNVEIVKSVENTITSSEGEYGSEFVGKRKNIESKYSGEQSESIIKYFTSMGQNIGENSVGMVEGLGIKKAKKVKKILNDILESVNRNGDRNIMNDSGVKIFIDKKNIDKIKKLAKDLNNVSSGFKNESALISSESDVEQLLHSNHKIISVQDRTYPFPYSKSQNTQMKSVANNIFHILSIIHLVDDIFPEKITKEDITKGTTSYYKLFVGRCINKYGDYWTDYISKDLKSILVFEKKKDKGYSPEEFNNFSDKSNSESKKDESSDPKEIGNSKKNAEIIQALDVEDSLGIHTIIPLLNTTETLENLIRYIGSHEELNSDVLIATRKSNDSNILGKDSLKVNNESTLSHEQMTLQNDSFAGNKSNPMDKVTSDRDYVVKAIIKKLLKALNNAKMTNKYSDFNSNISNESEDNTIKNITDEHNNLNNLLDSTTLLGSTDTIPFSTLKALRKLRGHINAHPENEEQEAEYINKSGDDSYNISLEELSEDEDTLDISRNYLIRTVSRALAKIIDSYYIQKGSISLDDGWKLKTVGTDTRIDREDFIRKMVENGNEEEAAKVISELSDEFSINKLNELLLENNLQPKTKSNDLSCTKDIGISTMDYTASKKREDIEDGIGKDEIYDKDYYRSYEDFELNTVNTQIPLPFELEELEKRMKSNVKDVGTQCYGTWGLVTEYTEMSEMMRNMIMKSQSKLADNDGFSDSINQNLSVDYLMIYRNELIAQMLKWLQSIESECNSDRNTEYDESFPNMKGSLCKKFVSDMCNYGIKGKEKSQNDDQNSELRANKSVDVGNNEKCELEPSKDSSCDDMESSKGSEKENSLFSTEMLPSNTAYMRRLAGLLEEEIQNKETPKNKTTTIDTEVSLEKPKKETTYSMEKENNMNDSTVLENKNQTVIPSFLQHFFSIADAEAIKTALSLVIQPKTKDESIETDKIKVNVKRDINGGYIYQYISDRTKARIEKDATESEPVYLYPWEKKYPDNPLLVEHILKQLERRNEAYCYSCTYGMDKAQSIEAILNQGYDDPKCSILINDGNSVFDIQNDFSTSLFLYNPNFQTYEAVHTCEAAFALLGPILALALIRRETRRSIAEGKIKQLLLERDSAHRSLAEALSRGGDQPIIKNKGKPRASFTTSMNEYNNNNTYNNENNSNGTMFTMSPCRVDDLFDVSPNYINKIEEFRAHCVQRVLDLDDEISKAISNYDSEYAQMGSLEINQNTILEIENEYEEDTNPEMLNAIADEAVMCVDGILKMHIHLLSKKCKKNRDNRNLSTNSMKTDSIGTTETDIRNNDNDKFDGYEYQFVFNSAPKHEVDENKKEMALEAIKSSAIAISNLLRKGPMYRQFTLGRKDTQGSPSINNMSITQSMKDNSDSVIDTYPPFMPIFVSRARSFRLWAAGAGYIE